ncbi:MAG: hypothetical protein K6E20_00600, partial [Acholeplasmatales bacterium]|nr:hypothetical protein [Acholeplasmatales bacterium]
MKTRILISSNSGIDYIDHNKDIRSIPDKLVMSDSEKYNEYEEIKLDNLYMRLRYSNEKFDVDIPNYNVIKSIIEEDLKESYERFVFLVDKNKNDYYDLIRKIKS